MKKRHFGVVENIREIIFGLEDGLVSTLGAVTGIAAGAQNTFVVLLSGIVLVVVEALSMAAGSYLSSKSTNQAEAVAFRRSTEHSHPIRGGFVMGFAYIFAGLVPLAPYFFLPIHSAYAPSILFTVIALFLVGVWSAKYTKRPKARSGFEMAGISLAATLIGFLIGRVVSHYFGIRVL